MSDRSLLEVGDLKVTFETGEGRATHALAGITFSLTRGRTLGLVGESGCGKTVTALAILRLLPNDIARVSGSIRFEGRELLALSERAMQDLRGNRIAMIFQEPMTSLNPSYTVGEQVGETLVRHRRMSKREARSETKELLKRVRIPSPATRINDYPHKLSGGMRQRVMIAIALACRPSLLIADEPTTALDVTIQAQILDLLRNLRDETEMALILISHDLGVVAKVCDEVAVMYAGEIVEQAPIGDLFDAPQHPYTVGLIGSIPRLDVPRARLATIRGTVPSLWDKFKGCRFASRCPFADERCRREPPAARAVGRQHFSRCWKAPLEKLLS
jgi:peptide/nickel transport system ATP-binding protein